MLTPIQTYRFLGSEGHPDHDVKVSFVDTEANIPLCLKELALVEARPTLVIVGGASGLDPGQQTQLRSLFNQVLAPLAEELQLHVVDGGTDAGVMSLMGHARASINGTFALVGVAPRCVVHLPDHKVTHPDASTLEPHHTHCILVPGNNWGDESPWLAEIATHLTGSHESVTILINGGSVTWQDACASVDEGREIVVMAGSGRTADIMVNALNGKTVEDPRMGHLLSSGLMSSIGLEDSPAALKAAIRELLLN